MTYPLRTTIPNRSAVEPKGNYRTYKAELRSDFSSRCGYCDDHDRTFGGSRGYHIDHFAPKSLFPHLETDYSNLVYSCPLCNIAKSDKWVGKNPTPSHDGKIGFVDPCGDEIDEYLIRDASGRIAPLNELGDYLIVQLKLNLLRHQLNWQIEMLRNLNTVLVNLMKDANQVGVDLGDAVNINADLVNLIVAYVEQNDQT